VELEEFEVVEEGLEEVEDLVVVLSLPKVDLSLEVVEDVLFTELLWASRVRRQRRTPTIASH